MVLADCEVAASCTLPLSSWKTRRTPLRFLPARGPTRAERRGNGILLPGESALGRRPERGNPDDLAGIHLAGPLPARRSLEQESQSLDVVRIIFAILLPPLGVFLQVGLGLHFWLNILLTVLGYIPGIVHAIWIIARR
jgi:uncharacterized membrane protein YqaE (UPF0057 family)